MAKEQKDEVAREQKVEVARGHKIELAREPMLRRQENIKTKWE